MSKEKHLKARQQLGLFFKARREQMGHEIKAIAAFVGISENTLIRIEAGAFDYDVSLLFRLCEALEVKPFFIHKEQESGFTDDMFNLNLN